MREVITSWLSPEVAEAIVMLGFLAVLIAIVAVNWHEWRGR